MLRALLFLAALACASDLASAQDLDGRLKQIGETRIIRLAYRSDANPFSFLSKQGHPDGYTIDLCKFVAGSLERQLGTKLTIEWVPVDTQNRFELNRCWLGRHGMRLEFRVLCPHGKGRLLKLYLHGKHGFDGTHQLRNFQRCRLEWQEDRRDCRHDQ